MFTIKVKLMPRLSLYKPTRGNDYYFLDKTILESFTVGGTDVLVHKYLGTDDGEVVKDNTQIQDLLFLENRDRKYDNDIYRIRGVYSVQDLDFDLSQFGLFLSNDTIFMTIHITSSVKTIGRKIMSGDVIELPHLEDEYAANDFQTALKRFYVVEDVNRAAEGFTPTWYPHLYRLKLKQLTDTQEFSDILNKPEDEDLFEGEYDETITYQVGQVVRYEGVLYEVIVETTDNLPTDTDFWKEYQDNTLRDLLSTYEREMQINAGTLAEADADAKQSGYDVSHLYTVALNHDGSVELQTVDESDIDASAFTATADGIYGKPDRLGYTGYLITDSQAPNGEAFGMGIQFPEDNVEGDYFLRTDFIPNRMFQFTGDRWKKMYDDVRMTMTNGSDRLTQKGTFVNNDNTTTVAGETFPEKQSLSKALKPKADN
jgi:hypothetical protein